MTESMERQEPSLDSHNPTGDELEAGIASVFAAIQAEGRDDEGDEVGSGSDSTFAILAELNRIWTSPAT